MTAATGFAETSFGIACAPDGIRTIMAQYFRATPYGGTQNKIPTGFHHPAQGWPATRDYPGKTENNLTNSERVESIPHITLIECHLVTLQQLAILILKRNFQMMLRLSRDVIPHRFNLRKTD